MSERKRRHVVAPLGYLFGLFCLPGDRRHQEEKRMWEVLVVWLPLCAGLTGSVWFLSKEPGSRRK
ncbi:MAG: hypothetical protein SFU56_13860 [Capsulimonadales bacterium]|nr:hypothetical protein [Capsulimonadales bacterium]